MLRGYADVHVPYPVVHALRRRGMDVVTAQELGQREADDALLLAQAYDEQRTLLTCDQDFLRLAADLNGRGAVFAPVFFWPQQRRQVGELVRSILRESRANTFAAASCRVFYF